MTDPDVDLDSMDRAALLAVSRAMPAAIRAHRDRTGHGLCSHYPDMWALLPDTPSGGQVVPDWLQFMRGCIAYRTALKRELKAAPRTADKGANVLFHAVVETAEIVG